MEYAKIVLKFHSFASGITEIQQCIAQSSITGNERVLIASTVKEKTRLSTCIRMSFDSHLNVHFRGFACMMKLKGVI